MRAIVCGVCLLFAVGSAVQAQESHSKAGAKPVTVEFKNIEGQSVGTAQLSSTPKGVKISLDIRNLPPGEHSIHIHQVAKCEAPDFKTDQAALCHGKDRLKATLQFPAAASGWPHLDRAAWPPPAV